MSPLTSSTRSYEGAARIVAPVGGMAGLGGFAWTAGLPTWTNIALWTFAAVLAIGSAVNTAVARGRLQQTTARHNRTSTDDHVHVVAIRSRIRELLADPTLTGSRRRELERTYSQLNGSP